MKSGIETKYKTNNNDRYVPTSNAKGNYLVNNSNTSKGMTFNLNNTSTTTITSNRKK